ncbi:MULTISPECIES: hypothetical protein [unclassified Paenibacillus]|uniref:hypothetical protein n=1 Tax=unclassified Paenibacillus TaxID=185978 RepID=UPI000CFD23FB|nr:MULTISPECIES: hypothetical protein [unclassified Paenibacillus]PRA07781.1 hypothetical protein CQ043_10495 [Paenibacillus sp. MYb63]PRA51426.1 hypothetical protein CQ061_03650 [Paenibacillus sp. MYb67]QZN74552.1 hypothetical protein K5K90_24645 [Paenibacillus sp. DR312]
MVRDRKEERTGFQESAPYHPDYDLQTDFVMVYGMDDTMPQRIQEWKDKGYVVHLMTGVAWGTYNDYLDGEVDGETHWDEAQMDRDGEMIVHGKEPIIPYMVPTVSFGKYIAERIRAAVDSGVEAIHLEEPEFWVNGGYSESFKREWQLYYKEPWSPPHSSPDAQFRASKLKAYLYTRVLDRLCTEMKDYALKRYNRILRFYVPTHSLINYTQWRIVSPQSRLIELPSVDGYIAQIWTGTSRTPNVYEGVRKERTFETAYLEYGVMQELVRGTDRRMWFLHDPIEDNPNYTWADYKQNYLKTVAASLLHPGVSHYEVAPWPRRIFKGTYPSDEGTHKERIPPDYATTLLHVMHTLGNMDQDNIETEGESLQIGVLIADSAMFQRMKPEPEAPNAGKYDGTDPEGFQADGDTELLDFSSFYGLALPLLQHGIPVRPVQFDNVRRYPHYLVPYRVLLLSYEYMKPEHSDIHYALAQWVQDGGALIYVGDDSDPYHNIRAWWNDDQRRESTNTIYTSPREHLFEQLGLKGEQEGIHPVGKGAVHWLPVHPAACTSSKASADQLRQTVKETWERLQDSNFRWEAKHYFKIKRGPYIIASVLEESISEAPLVIPGPVVDLFDPDLHVRQEVRLAPGEQALLYDITAGRPQQEKVSLISASSRIEDLTITNTGFQCVAKGPTNMQATARFYCPFEPISVCSIDQHQTVPAEWKWDSKSKTVLLNYEHGSKNKVEIQVRWDRENAKAKA